MNNRDIEWRKKKLEQMRLNLESGQLNAIRELIPNEVIKDICGACSYDFRVRLLTPIVTVFQMIQTGLSRDGSFQSAWHLNGQAGQSGSLAKARKRLPVKVWAELHHWMMEQIRGEMTESDQWRGHRMIGVDGTCVSMSDEPSLSKVFGRCATGDGGLSRFPFARMVLAFDLKSLMTIGYGIGGYCTSEQGLLRGFLGDFKQGDVMIVDRQFAGSNLYWEYQDAGIDFIGRVHKSLCTERLKAVKTLGPEERIVEMPIGEVQRQRNSRLPQSIHVRIIQTTAKRNGKKETFWLATSLLDPKRYPLNEIREWYKKRWKVETLIEELKVWLNADILRSKTPEGIRKELYARILGMNLIHWLIFRASQKHRQDRERISVAAALRLTVAYSLKMSTAPCWQLPALYEQLLERIASSRIPYRPDRFEPRLQKREHKNYPKLKIPRSKWKAILQTNLP